jgi:O-antigen ligase/polysaccharide polymerase Wzy-like membrane protein
MTARDAISPRLPGLGLHRHTSLADGARNAEQAIRILQVFTLLLFAIPSVMVLRPIGAVGYPAGIVGLFAFAGWAAALLFGQVDLKWGKQPIRGVLCLIWVVSLISYGFMDRGAMTSHQLLSADRWLMQLAIMSGIALIAAEFLTSMDDVRRVVRALSWGGAFCGVVAALQFKAGIDLTHYIHIPGFGLNSADTGNLGIGFRSGQARVPGTATDPIELGVTASMILPITIWLAMYDKERRPLSRWLPVILTMLAIPASVSRSAVIAIALTVAVFIVLMPACQRLTAFQLLPIPLLGIFMTAHGLIGTLGTFLGYGSGDPSIAHRVNNYAYVEHLVREAPWFGSGGGTYLPTVIHILDNEYLTTTIQLGLAGLLALGVLFIVPMIVALAARARSRDPELRLLCAALVGALLAATVCSAFFDSLSFPLFYNVCALALGLAGACWRLSAPGRPPRRRGVVPGMRPMESASTKLEPAQARGG